MMVCDLELQPLDVARPLALALGGVGEQRQPGAFQASKLRLLAEVVVQRHRACRRPRPGVGKSGSCGLPSTSVRLQRRAMATVLASALGRSANSAAICGLGLEALLAREAAHPLGVGQRLALGDAHARLVRLEVVGSRNCTGCVATTGRPSSAASGTAARTWARAWAGRRAAARCRSGPGKRRPSLRHAAARAASPASRAWPTAPRSAPDSAISPPPSSASQSHLTQACARCALRVQARASSSDRLW
jgi:hypothetical protein